jgi:hypothetical protein
MGTKLIFFKHPDTGQETFHFCPIGKVKCADCFLPPCCKGEQDRRVAFNLRLRRVGETLELLSMSGIRAKRQLKE